MFPLIPPGATCDRGIKSPEYSTSSRMVLEDRWRQGVRQYRLRYTDRVAATERRSGLQHALLISIIGHSRTDPTLEDLLTLPFGLPSSRR